MILLFLVLTDGATEARSQFRRGQQRGHSDHGGWWSLVFHGILHGCSLGPEAGLGYGFMVHLLGDAISSL